MSDVHGQPEEEEGPASVSADGDAEGGPSDGELLRLVGEERRRSIGLDNSAELTADREQALDYIKGSMPKVKAPPNRSQAVSTDIADAIATILPDLVEIFTGGDDVAAFIPRGPQDEQAAQQETDYVNYVVFAENSGWLDFYTFFSDALEQKTGLLKYWWEETTEEEELQGQNLLALQAITAGGAKVVDLKPSASQPQGGQPLLPGLGADPTLTLYDVKVQRKSGKVCMKPIPPEDFAVAQDATLDLQSTTYCVVRARPRAQELLARGVDPALVEQLPPYGVPTDQIDQARDTADESTMPAGGSGDMRQVEVHEHFIRLYDEDQKRMRLWRVETSADEAILLEREEVDRIQVCAITPYIVTHRFYGRSVADLLAEIQKINTVITRAHLDSIYFALNRRHEVSDADANEFTIGDLLRNEPGMPVRSKSGNAIHMIGEGPPTFDALGTLEYFQTVAERRTGIVRAAQGLTPDTLHETARGALALLNQAQKRTRLIARIFAETGVKDLFLGVHWLCRKYSTQQATVQLRGQWTTIDPTTWGERRTMTIEVGLGASGREQDLQALQAMGPMFQQIVQMQGGPHGPIVTLQNAYNYAKRVVQKSGIKAPEQLVTDPSTAPPPGAPGAPGGQPPAPPPNPEMIKAQGMLQIAQAKAQSDAQVAQVKAQADGQAAQAQAQAQMQADRYKADVDAQLKREQMAQDLQLKREQLAGELQLKRELAMYGQPGLASQVHPGGLPG